MTILYCIEGATYNGDGTASNEAASAGASGAFNDAIACLDGSETLISDGDTVIYKTYRSGADITVTCVTALTILGAVSTSSIRSHIFDDGTVWPSENGIFTIDVATYLTVQEIGTYIEGYDFRLRILNSQLSLGLLYTLNVASESTAFFNGIHFECTGTGSYSYLRLITSGYYARVALGAIKLSIYKLSNNSGHTPFIGFSGQHHASLESLELVFDPAGPDYKTSGKSGYHLFEIGSSAQPAYVEINNLTLSGVPDDIDWVRNPVNGTSYNVKRLVYDNTDYVFLVDDLVDLKIADMQLSGVGNFDFREAYADVVTQWRVNQNYPTLNALLPDESTKWSFKVDLGATIVKQQVRRATTISKYFGQAAGLKILTVEVLIYDQFVAPLASEFWCIFTYLDTTGIIRTESTRGLGGSLATSSAVWDTTGYGPANFNEYKFELTTAHQVAQDTIIKATTFVSATVPDASSFYFVDPTIGIS